MDLSAVGTRIKQVRMAQGITQEVLAEMAEISATHMSVIERGLKAPRLDTFVAIANSLDVSADFLLVDVLSRSLPAVTAELSERINALSPKDQKKAWKILQILTETEEES